MTCSGPCAARRTYIGRRIGRCPEGGASRARARRSRCVRRSGSLWSRPSWRRGRSGMVGTRRSGCRAGREKRRAGRSARRRCCVGSVLQRPYCTPKLSHASSSHASSPLQVAIAAPLEQGFSQFRMRRTASRATRRSRRLPHPSASTGSRCHTRELSAVRCGHAAPHHEAEATPLQRGRFLHPKPCGTASFWCAGEDSNS